MATEKISSIIMERGVPAVMRDGTVLRADVYRPAGEGRYPVLLQRTPYNKGFLPFTALTLDPLAAAHAGYVVIIQDVRGRFTSEGGPYYLYRDEFQDGYDSVEWAAALPYSNGQVGMYGVSYMGMTQFQAAAMSPSHLKAIFPATWGTDVYFHRGGAFELGLVLYWAIASVGPDALLRAKKNQPDLLPEFLQLVDSIDHIEKAYEYLPLAESPWLKLGNGYGSFIKDLLEHGTYDDYHQTLSARVKTPTLEVPAFCAAGWHDVLLGPDLDHFQRIKREAATETARKRSRLMVGPWAHAGFLPCVTELNYGTAASGFLLELKRDFTSLHMQWFDYWLKGLENGITEEAPVKIFVMGENRWRDEQEWPLARTQYIPYYLHSKGEANTPGRDGTLSPLVPGREEPDRFVYNPKNPVPTQGGNILMPLNYLRGPFNQVLVEERPDVLVYRTAPLENPLEITGPITMKLFAASSAVDTDFTAKLVDVYPDGRIYNLADGIIRASFRNGVRGDLITPGEVYEYTIDLWATSNLFQAGHCIGLEISSSNFPRFDRNLNTGHSGYTSAEMVSAGQTIWHNENYPSHIVLPVIPR
jgi:uncharacterized protein